VARQFRLCGLGLLAVTALVASEHRGEVTFNGLPVPGATVTAARAGKTFTAVTDSQGLYSLAGLEDGVWIIEVEMFGFQKTKQEVAVAPEAPAAKWELKLLPLEEIQADVQVPEAPAKVATLQKRPPEAQSPPAQVEDSDLSERAADGLLINGSVNNGAASPFAQAAAFGNRRILFGKGLYHGGIGIIAGNSALDARPFSLTGQDTPKASYSRVTGTASVGGPLAIPHLFETRGNFFAGYQWMRNANATTAPALVPDAAQRGGVFPQAIIDPLTGAPFRDNTIPEDRISPQARALLALYPAPNFEGNSRYNYQAPITGATHRDALQARAAKPLGTRDQVFGGFALESTRSDSPSLFGFLDTRDVLGINANANWWHRFSYRWSLSLGFQYSRLAARSTPYFANRRNVSGDAGISGNNQEPANWGPPSLVFSSGIAGLSDSESSFNRNQTSGLSYSVQWIRGSHNITFGGDFRRQQFNFLAQQDPRGTFTFTGAQTGSAFADFLLGLPAASSIAFGNADKYFRESVYDAYFTDDWRISAALTVNAGMRWEYGAPITELYGRLVNLGIAPGFTAAAPVVAADPSGAVTGRSYPKSLVNPDKGGIEPRVGLAWRPLPASSLVVRAGYGVYRDSSVYQTIAMQMAQQPPLSKTLSVQNSAANPLTLANGFTGAGVTTANTFAIDPDFRVGYAQNWQLSVQRDLPGALQMTAMYLGIRGTHAMQEFLPNTYPAGAANPCPACPAGFAYLASNANSTRHAAQLQLRRRLRSGFTAALQYTFSKSIDDAAALGGQGGGQGNSGAALQALPRLAIAQNWLDLRAERGLSSFDQRHLLTAQVQYTTGMGLGGGALLSGWKGALFKQWTLATEITAGSGLPQTPVYLAPVAGTGVTGTLRPDYTGAALYAAPAGLYLNPAAYAAPQPGQWGDAGRNSITGPAQFALNASLARGFRLNDRLNLDFRVDASNALNHVGFTAWNTTVNSAQFGLPAAANAMRTIQTTWRMRF
jgi:hypothetical protein